MPTPTPATIEQLEAGMRFCVSDGECCILPNEPAHIVRCIDCFLAKKKSRYCHTCGEPIDDARRNFARNRNSEARFCWPCSNGKGIGRKTLMKALSASKPS